MTSIAVALLVGALIGSSTTTVRGGHMLHRFTSTRRRKLATATAALVLVAGVAVAAWLLSSRGNGTASFGSLQNVGLSPAASTARDCFPGGTCAARLTANNPNGALLAISVASGDGSGGVGNGTPSSCVASISVNEHALATPVPVPAGSSIIEIPNAFRIASDAPSECQGGEAYRDVRLTFSTP
jgi:hypothetical protein